MDTIKMIAFFLEFHGFALVIGSFLVSIFANSPVNTYRDYNGALTERFGEDIRMKMGVKIFTADIVGAIFNLLLGTVIMLVLGILNSLCSASFANCFLIIFSIMEVVLLVVLIRVKTRLKGVTGNSYDGSKSQDTKTQDGEDIVDVNKSTKSETLVGRDGNKSLGIVVPAGVVMILTMLQVVLVIVGQASDPEAFRLIRYSTIVFEKGICTPNTPFMNMWGAMAHFFGIHPARFIFTVLPIVLIPIYYGVYYILARNLFRKNSHSLWCMIIICMLHIFSYSGSETLSINMLSCFYCGWVYTIDGLLPIIAVLVIKYIEMRQHSMKVSCVSLNAKTVNLNGEEMSLEENDDYPEEWDMKKHPIVNARNLAIALGGVVVLLLILVFMLNRKINTLYDATVNLQSEMNSRCSIYEFCPVEGADPEGYLVVDSQGKLTMVGGGGIDYTDEVYDFIIKYGNTVEDWYVYGDEDADRGAYDGCIIYKDLIIKNVYKIEREDAAK